MAALPETMARPTPVGRMARLALVLDAARRLGPRPVGLAAWHRLRLATGAARRGLPDVALPAGALLPGGHGAVLPPAADWHGPFDAGAHALDLDLFGPGDIRPVWETNRLLALPLLAAAARADPAGGHAAEAAALLDAWRAANPPFRGPAWACGQEAALRAMHLCLALVLLDVPASPAMRALLAAHATRIEATRAYAAAQDNNHAVSEPAGLFVIGLMLGDAALARRGAHGLAYAVARLVAPDGAFAQASPAYHRLLLDTLAVAEWFRRRQGWLPFADPFPARARAATLWLHRVASPGGALPRAGACDDSAFADLARAGAHDAGASLERAARLFCGASAGRTAEPGCALLGLPCPPDVLPRASQWRTEGWMGAEAGPLRALLRTGAPLRFRPAQADLLHLDLWRGEEALLRDGGTGAYNPGPGRAWWSATLAGTAGHNTVEFDGEDQMPRVSRFLYARWPACRALPDGAVLTDHRGRRHERRLRLSAAQLEVEDSLSGPFSRAVLRWRLAPGPWRPTATGAERPGMRLALGADVPHRIRLAEGWESPAYGEVRPAPVLELALRGPAARIATRVEVA
ncbi:heparinase II/III family protein [Roseomonas sp. HF4]|uniref:heparinase II/III domain-containing protein n=1 Tax=Roseomonas sp. HF4 TaxID=2562313 RepID=UPI001F0F307E|nr:heparinase II/III family protein [Roseomonas sp. HF4]